MSKPRIRINWRGFAAAEELRESLIANVPDRHKAALKGLGFSNTTIGDLIMVAEALKRERDMPRLSWAEIREELVGNRSSVAHLVKFYEGGQSIDYMKMRLASAVWRDRGEGEDVTISDEAFLQKLRSELRYLEDAIVEWDNHKWRGPENSLEVGFTMDVCSLLTRDGHAVTTAPKGAAVQTVQILFQGVLKMDVMPPTAINWIKAWLSYAEDFPSLVAAEWPQK